MGIYSCLGKNLEEVTQSLYAGKSGIGIDPMRKEYSTRPVKSTPSKKFDNIFTACALQTSCTPG